MNEALAQALTAATGARSAKLPAPADENAPEGAPRLGGRLADGAGLAGRPARQWRRPARHPYHLHR
eukprot:182160-Pleurochrysis_carterae.AAC.1